MIKKITVHISETEQAIDISRLALEIAKKIRESGAENGKEIRGTTRGIEKESSRQ